MGFPEGKSSMVPSTGVFRNSAILETESRTDGSIHQIFETMEESRMDSLLNDGSGMDGTLRQVTPDKILSSTPSMKSLPPFRVITTSPQYDDVSKVTTSLELSSSFDTALTNNSGHSRQSTSGMSTRVKQIKTEQYRRKVVELIHAALCQHDAVKEGYSCPNQKYCAAAKRVHIHMTQCQNFDCWVPGCYKSRRIWGHFLKCEDDACPVCIAIPMDIRIRLRNAYNDTRTTLPRHGRKQHTFGATVASNSFGMASNLIDTNSTGLPSPRTIDSQFGSAYWPKSPDRPPLSPGRPSKLSPKQQQHLSMPMEI